MKILTFFSAKGGTGKTTFNVLLASYLKYELGHSVLFLDFDAPSFNACLIRSKEMSSSHDESTLYPIQKVEDQSQEKILTVVRNISSLKDQIDYVVCDFRGSFSKEDPVLTFAQYGILNKVIIPIELDNTILSSANTLASIFTHTHQDVTLFFNRVYGKENMQMYKEVRRMFLENGHQVSEHMVRNAVNLRRDSGSVRHLRSTVMFPKRRIENENPGIIKLFEEVIR
mgnify:CR=1 FL=1